MHSRSSFSFFSDDDMMFCLLIVDLKITVFQLSPIPSPQIMSDESFNSSVAGSLRLLLGVAHKEGSTPKSGFKRAAFSAIIFRAAFWISLDFRLQTPAVTPWQPKR
jgi:hypothetical protein